MPIRPIRPGEDIVADLVWDLAVLADRAVVDAGGDTDSVNPTQTVAAATALLRRGDGLLLVGGGDVDPHLYGGPPDHPSISHVDADRDAFEIALIEAALAARIPVLALCRGMQVLNVALGGTLVQQVRDDVMRHHGPDPAVLMLAHPVRAEEDSSLAAVIGTGKATVWSGHHQGVDRLGAELRVTASAPDGLVEAVEHRDAPAVAVQWHPEYGHAPGRMPDPLFTDLVDRARRHCVERAGRSTQAWL
ncbi:gamma-glutamyl-gamma-aminobutyrate hydrolase family protein [Pseudonocardia sp. MH-G8]|uniref:gamma-glutamyl-gamma-aminobutyrate hydrolase family protein n=1 Tax=Pseudonocardia sp. MH-G8 TaxID=1854588 RepID=UPI000B9FD9F9|nr:gamma-glutamyl-gamma-aminobutyrate hydrolase family protein [Pseudonocardia sp. MH-G8]OZM77085.1 hypothetical protein CFP66_37500 [Pseudonocardia sp. MH-G8]